MWKEKNLNDIKKIVENVEFKGVVESLDFQKIIEKGILLTNVRILFTEPLNVSNIFLKHQKRASGSVVKYSRSKIQTFHLKRKRYESST